MRDLLAPLAPCKVGTTDGESLSSYVQRLAAANGTLPGPLLHRLVAWSAAATPTAIGTWARRTGVVRLGHNINGFTHADHWARVLTTLTRRAGIPSLTTHTWDRFFPTRHFLKPFLAWCPLCLREDHIPYHRLLWALGPASVCLQHSVALVTSCPGCARVLPVIHERSGVTHCPWYTFDLRNADPSTHPVDFDSFEVWCVRELGRVVAATGAQDGRMGWPHLRIFRELIKMHGFRNAAEAARFIGTSRITGWYWWSGGARPSLLAWLRIFFRFEASFAAQLLQRPFLDRDLRTVSSQQEIYLSLPHRPRKIDWLKIKGLLSAEIEMPLGDARSLLAVSRKLGIAARLLRVHEPRLCRKIGRRYRERCRVEARHRQQALRKRILSACRKLTSLGRPITQQNIAELLDSPGLFCRHDARRIFHTVIGSHRLIKP